MTSIAIAILILGLFGGTILRRHLREAKLLRLREISHQERMMAMEQNVPAPDANVSRIDSLLVEGEGGAAKPDRFNRTSVNWVRMAALAIGLTLLFGGLGAIPGLYFQVDPEASGAWPLGLVPIFVGAGLLIFVRLSREMAVGMIDQEASR